jgi:hypothetical protein
MAGVKVTGLSGWERCACVSSDDWAAHVIRR